MEISNIFYILITDKVGMIGLNAHIVNHPYNSKYAAQWWSRYSDILGTFFRLMVGKLLKIQFFFV